MRSSVPACRKALSPYAQALKHVALRGAVALGPSAKEMELDMFRKGTLPADYRPPVQGRWDDTIERWAYAWQFPAEEEEEDVVAEVEKNAGGMQALLEVGQRLLHSPPSSEPRSGQAPSSLYPPVRLEAVDSTVTREVLQLRGSAVEGDSGPDYAVLEEDLLQLAEAVAPRELGNPDPSACPAGDAACAKAMMPAHEYSQRTSIPVAYLDDASEMAHASQELGAILEDHLGLEYTGEGLIVVVAALSRTHHIEEARAIFDFAAQVGLGPSAELYKALMKHFSSTGDVNGAMSLVEEMKSRGITPRIGNWHELMRAFHQAKDYAAVSQIVDNMKMYANIEPNEVTFALQLRALAKDRTQLNSLAEAAQLFDQMENVYGFIASRPHYHALLAHLSQSPSPEMRRRCEELAKKMEIMGIVWNGDTYLYLIKSAQVVGDVSRVEALFARMRDNKVPVTLRHLTWAVQAHVQHIVRLDFAGMKSRGEDALAVMLEAYTTCFGVYDLVVQRGWVMELPFVNALLRLCCQGAMLAMEHVADDVIALGHLEDQAACLWAKTFDEWRLEKDVYSYECYISLLGHQQRVDEAERVFQQMVLRHDMTPTRRTYECLIFMHLSSGEEGGTARALRYLEAMESAGIAIRPSLLKKIVRVNNAAGYTRDMKRRARRIMQAREEYMARKAEGIHFESSTQAQRPDAPPMHDADGNPILAPLPVPKSSTLAWWDTWRRDSISKHELFSEEGSDGLPRGESFADKNEALRAMGIDSKFVTRADVPDATKQRLLTVIRREEGEMAGSLWALDGGDLAYPKDGGGPQGWGVRLWRERQLVQREFQKVVDGDAAAPDFSALGIGSRVAGDQLDIERSGAKGPQQLADYRQFPDQVYDHGGMKPATEMAHAPSPLEDLVWHGEVADRLQPYKTDAELAMQNDNAFFAQMESGATRRIQNAVEVIKRKQEDHAMIIGSGSTRRSKHDYLEKWREMYRHGTLEAPEKPVLHFGRSPDDHHETLASAVRGWYERNRKLPPSDEQLQRWASEESRVREATATRANLLIQKRRRRRGMSARGTRRN